MMLHGYCDASYLSEAVKAVSDAGSAMVAAVRRTLPSCRHIICWYHMRTATAKKAQQLLNGSRGEGYNTGRLGADRPDYVALFMSHIDLLHCATDDSSFEADDFK